MESDREYTGNLGEFLALGLIPEGLLHELEGDQSDLLEQTTPDSHTDIVTSLSVGPMSVRFSHSPRRGLSFQLWPSAVALAKHFLSIVESEPTFFSGKHAIELGAGTGFLGCFASMLGAHVFISDLAKTLPMINHTIDLNNVRFPSLQPHPITGVPFYTGSAQAIEINWAEPPPLQTVLDSFSSFSRGPEESIHPVDSVDFIFATDCVYDRNFHDMLLPTLLSLASPQTTVFFANVKRFKSDSKFWKKLGKKFLIKTLEIEPESGGKRGRGGVTIRVCTLKNTL